ncbi:hepatic lectin-like [Clarias gariepinus]|uniref:hepatic lectin-like n=1 Tax=Clarias gariepinus TaxID=13013 RepID=UPI00234CD5E2|nr:hepatic lectin-like [Clarias gariepinus]
MSNIMSEYVNYTEKREDHIERVVEIYDSMDGTTGHNLKEAATDFKKSLQTKHTVEDTAWSRCYRLTAVCMLLLCVLMLTAVTVLWIKCKNLTIMADQLQLQRDQFKQENSELHSMILKLGWKVFNSKIYISTENESVWEKSREDCKKKGADLVTINSTEEQEFISKYYGDTEAWIGLTDTYTEGTFKWVDNSSLTTAFWWKGQEPNDYNGNEDCVITGYRHAGSNLTTWADYSCQRSVVGICEIKIFTAHGSQ